MQATATEKRDRKATFKLPRLQEFGLLAVVLVLGSVLSIQGHLDRRTDFKGNTRNTFLNVDNLLDGITTPMSYYAIMAVGMTVVVITGGIDISVGSVMALSGLITAYTLQRFPTDASIFVVGPLSILVPLGVGLACGLINGLLIVGGKMHPFIVTLATLSIFRGIGNVLPFDAKTLPVGGGVLPSYSVTHLFGAQWYGMQIVPLLVMLAVVGVGWIYLQWTVFGRQTYAVGGNAEAARFSGLPVGSVLMRTYAISGLLAGLAGLVSLGRFGTISTNSGTGYELIVVAATVVGGASLSGGRGTALGALLGTLVLMMIENAINILHLNQEYRSIIIGLAILIAVAIDRFSDYLRKQRALAHLRGPRGFPVVDHQTGVAK